MSAAWRPAIGWPAVFDVTWHFGENISNWPDGNCDARGHSSRPGDDDDDGDRVDDEAALSSRQEVPLEEKRNKSSPRVPPVGLVTNFAAISVLDVSGMLLFEPGKFWKNFLIYSRKNSSSVLRIYGCDAVSQLVSLWNDSLT